MEFFSQDKNLKKKQQQINNELRKVMSLFTDI